MLRDSMPSKAPASAAQDMTRWKGGVPGTMMLTMKVKGALLALHTQIRFRILQSDTTSALPGHEEGCMPVLLRHQQLWYCEQHSSCKK